MILASTAELGNVVDLVGLQLNASIFVVWVYTTFRDHSKDSATLTKYHKQVSKCIHFEFLLLLHGFHKAACFCFDSATATVLAIYIWENDHLDKNYKKCFLDVFEHFRDGKAL